MFTPDSWVVVRTCQLLLEAELVVSQCSVLLLRNNYWSKWLTAGVKFRGITRGRQADG